jgi:hypothetical protein
MTTARPCPALDLKLSESDSGWEEEGWRSQKRCERWFKFSWVEFITNGLEEVEGVDS